MPRRFSDPIKLICVVALAIVISFGRVELANAYHQQPDTTQIANDDGRDKGDHGNGKDKDNGKEKDSKGNANTKEEAKVSEKSQPKSESKTSQGNNPAGPAGNNGTVKIHEGAGEASPERQEDSHVCTFHIHGFNFDSGSTGTWEIVAQAPGGGAGAHGSWGPASASGEWRTPGAMTLTDGHYKLSWRQLVPSAPGGDKHKVFWVECAAQGGGNGSNAEQTRAQLNVAIGNAQTLQQAVLIRIANAQALLPTLTGQLFVNLANAISNASSAQTLLAQRILEAQTALQNLINAINAGNAVEIATRVTAAQQAMTNLNAAVTGAVNAHAQLGATITASGGIASTNQATTSSSVVEERAEREVATTAGTTTGATTTTVAGFQSAPQVSESSQTASQAGAQSATTGVQAGVQNLPSTNTSDETTALVILGFAFMVVGGALLRRRQITVR